MSTEVAEFAIPHDEVTKHATNLFILSKACERCARALVKGDYDTAVVEFLPIVLAGSQVNELQKAFLAAGEHAGILGASKADEE